jgi:hypothetical protein
MSVVLLLSVVKIVLYVYAVVLRSIVVYVYAQEQQCQKQERE